MDVAELFAEVRDSLADVFASIEWAEDEIAAAQRRWPARADALFHSFSLTALSVISLHDTPFRPSQG